MHKVDSKIIFFVPRMSNGGAERVIATLANELESKRFRILILTLTTEESFYNLNDDVEIIGANYKINKDSGLKRTLDISWNGIKSIFFFLKVIKNWKPDIVISFLTHTNIISIIGKLLYPKLNLIVSERAEPNLRNRLTKLITKYSYPLADFIVCQSNIVASFYPKYAQSKIKIIENPVNEESISKIVHRERRKVIVAVGRLFQQKNFTLLINSFSDISIRFPDYNLEIYGEGPLRSSLQNQINELGLSDKVFLMGVRKNVMKIVSDSQLFVMSSNFEGFPNALVEAMASGLPVISTDFSTGVARELISKENGYIVPINDRRALSNAIEDILSNKNKRKKMGYENIKIREKLSVDKIVNKWINLFKEFNLS